LATVNIPAEFADEFSMDLMEYESLKILTDLLVHTQQKQARRLILDSTLALIIKLKDSHKLDQERYKPELTLIKMVLNLPNEPLLPEEKDLFRFYLGSFVESTGQSCVGLLKN
jgi:hypothetical protein